MVLFGEPNHMQLRTNNILILRPGYAGLLKYCRIEIIIFGASRFSSSRVRSIRDSFLLLYTTQLMKVMVINDDLFHAYLPVILLTGAYK